MSEFSPCPLCGAPAHGLSWGGRYVIECSKNNNRHCVYIVSNSKEEALMEWNARNQKKEE